MKLNKAQKHILVIYMVFLIIACLYVPWLGSPSGESKSKLIATKYAPL